MSKPTCELTNWKSWSACRPPSASAVASGLLVQCTPRSDVCSSRTGVPLHEGQVPIHPSTTQASPGLMSGGSPRTIMLAAQVRPPLVVRKNAPYVAHPLPSTVTHTVANTEPTLADVKTGTIVSVDMAMPGGASSCGGAVCRQVVPPSSVMSM